MYIVHRICICTVNNRVKFAGMCKHMITYVPVYVSCRYRGERVLPAPGRGAVGPVAAPAPVHPGGREDFQDFHQDNGGGSADHHLLRGGARPGVPERGVLQVHKACSAKTYNWLTQRLLQCAGATCCSLLLPAD